MASTYESRDNPNFGNESTVPLGYPAVVRYTFTPQTTEFNELYVSEGDIVQLLYSVGGWVYVKNYKGQTGYIPIQYCLTLDSSKRLGSIFDDVGLDAIQDTSTGEQHKQQPEDVTGYFYQTLAKSKQYGKLFSEQPSHRDLELDKKPPSYTVGNTNGHFVRPAGQIQLSCDNITDRPPTFPQRYDPKIKHNKIENVLQDNNLNGITIAQTTFNGTYCRFLSQIVLAIQNLAITDREKADLKSRKLLNILKLASKESSNLISVIRPAIERDKTYYVDINNSEETFESLLKVKGDYINQCPSCNILKEYFKDTGDISMSDLYSTIRNLHLHALSDSESDHESEHPKANVSLKNSTENHITRSQNDSSSSRANGCLSWVEPDSGKNGYPAKHNGDPGTCMKRSVSFQLQEKADSKPGISRNRSFSGRTSAEIENGSNQFQFKGNKILNGFGGDIPSKRPNAPPSYDEVFISECECSKSDSRETNNNYKVPLSNSKMNGINGNNTEISERLSNSRDHNTSFGDIYVQNISEMSQKGDLQLPQGQGHDTSFSSIKSDSSSKSDNRNDFKHNKLAESALNLLNSQARIYERTKQNISDGSTSSASNSSESIYVQKPKDLRDTQVNCSQVRDAQCVSDNEVVSNRTSSEKTCTSDKEFCPNYGSNSSGKSPQESRLYHDRQTVHENRSNHDHRQPVLSPYDRQPESLHNDRHQNFSRDRQPVLSNHNKNTALSHRERQTELSHYERQPAVSLHDKQHALSHHDRQPVSSNHDRQPALSHHDRQPALSHHDKQHTLSHRDIQPTSSNHDKQTALLFQRPNNQGAKPKSFQQLNFYGLASLSGSSGSHTAARSAEPDMPPESVKYATWGSRLDKKKIIARRLQIPGSPKENGPLSPRPDDKDIRKSLQGLSTTVKKTTQGPMKAQPMRAEHSIHVQSMEGDKQAPHKGRTVLVKQFNKKMWRAPSGLPEGTDQRPFSPFGGTLPPSKIVKKKVVEVFV